MRGIIAFVFSLVACATTATAGEGWYASVYGGANWDSVIDVPFVDSQQGYVAGATVGRTVPAIPGLRIEADLSYRTNDVEVFGGALTVQHETTGLLANLVYDIGSGPLTPYILVGGGWAHTEGSALGGLLKLEASDLAYQLGGGVQWQAMPGVRVGLGYRFFQGPQIEVFGTELSDGENHSAIASLSFDL